MPHGSTRWGLGTSVAACMQGLLTLSALAQTAPPEAPGNPASPPPSQPTTTAKVETVLSVRAPTPADELLTALENSGKSLRTLSAAMRYTKFPNELEGGDPQVNHGRLYFTSDAAPSPAGSASTTSAPPPNGDAAKARRMFQVDFDTLEVDGARREDKKTYIFDGQWFTEKLPASKQIFKRQVVAPGQTIDPLAIGEGPFPIPIGQRRDRILERFDAELVAWDEGLPAPAPAVLAECHQLRLVPKRGTQEARDFNEIRIWYRKDDLLPRMARTHDKNDARFEVFLTDTVVNKDLPPGTFDTVIPAGWDAEVSDFRRAADE